ncbi:MAG: hypothetical protein ACREQQ_08840, partial [Candidatus Binatia bacterium]
MGLAAVALLHAALVALAFSEPGDLASSPIANDDSTGHFYSALHTLEHLRRAGAFWGYDPYWMAGYPEGVAALIDNQLFALTVSLAPRGFEAAAYNAVFLLALISPPWLLYGA